MGLFLTLEFVRRLHFRDNPFVYIIFFPGRWRHQKTNKLELGDRTRLLIWVCFRFLNIASTFSQSPSNYSSGRWPGRKSVLTSCVPEAFCIWSSSLHCRASLLLVMCQPPFGRVAQCGTHKTDRAVKVAAPYSGTYTCVLMVRVAPCARGLRFVQLNLARYVLRIFYKQVVRSFAYLSGPDFHLSWIEICSYRTNHTAWWCGTLNYIISLSYLNIFQIKAYGDLYFAVCQCVKWLPPPLPFVFNVIWCLSFVWRSCVGAATESVRHIKCAEHLRK
jgi:hypothetical protein